MGLQEYLGTCQSRVDQQLKGLLPKASDVSQRLVEAMSYSVFNGGKRIRPVLVYAANQAVGGVQAQADAAACAVELIHAYSLVHDDLPAMDDDDLRRGKPTCHKAFDEATAILAGDALQALAFEVLAGPSPQLPDHSRIQLLHCLTQASGYAGMVGGQSMDLNSVGSPLTQAQLELMHSHKTGALIYASVRMGALSHNQASTMQLDQLDVYARAIGLAFQVQDDILDVTADTKTLGKRQGSDEALSKPTYVSLLGLEGARQLGASLCQEAIDAVAEFGHGAISLRQVADYIIHRSH